MYVIYYYCVVDRYRKNYAKSSLSGSNGVNVADWNFSMGLSFKSQSMKLSYFKEEEV